MGRLCAEVVEDLDPAPRSALRAAGASSFQALAYGVLPQALPQFLTYTLYRWEVIIRTTIVVGFVSAGGLGREFRLAMSFFHYNRRRDDPRYVFRASSSSLTSLPARCAASRGSPRTDVETR